MIHKRRHLVAGRAAAIIGVVMFFLSVSAFHTVQSAFTSPATTTMPRLKLSTSCRRTQRYTSEFTLARSGSSSR